VSAYFDLPVSPRQIASLELMPEMTASEVAALYRLSSLLLSAARRNSRDFARCAVASLSAPSTCPALEQPVGAPTPEWDGVVA